MGSVDSAESRPGSSRPFDVHSVAIIGAGPSGLVSAKYLLGQSQSLSTSTSISTSSSPSSAPSASSPFSRITIFEQQAEVGGVWNYSRAPSETTHVPQTSATCPPDPPLRDVRTPEGRPVFPSPMYETLNTNIPHTLMQYDDASFPDDVLIFPERGAIQTYLEAYSQEVRDLIRFSTSVVDVALRDGGREGHDRWDVRSRDWVTGRETTETYDAVVVASGHYSVTYTPDLGDIRAFHERWPGVITHSKHYRTPDAYAGKKVLVVGNSASGLDISAQLKQVCQQPLLVSVRTPTPDQIREHVGFEEVGQIERFLVEERGVLLKDGRVIADLDAVLFATGYLFTFPFLEKLDPALVTDGRRVYGLYKHLIHMRHPTLVFSGLPIKVMPFPVAQAQAAIFSRVWANAMALPPREEMEDWERREAERKGAKFHVFPKFGDAEYINEAYDWIRRAKAGGKEPPRWNDELLWETSIYPQAKLKFEQTGKKARTLGELGFHYEPKPDDAEIPQTQDRELNIGG